MQTNDDRAGARRSGDPEVLSTSEMLELLSRIYRGEAPAEHERERLPEHGTLASAGDEPPVH